MRKDAIVAGWRRRPHVKGAAKGDKDSPCPALFRRGAVPAPNPARSSNFLRISRMIVNRRSNPRLTN